MPDPYPATALAGIAPSVHGLDEPVKHPQKVASFRTSAPRRGVLGIPLRLPKRLSREENRCDRYERRKQRGCDDYVVDPAPVTDGPFPETKEVIGGFAIVDVPSREEALEWAAKIAVACRCAQEVRELMPDPPGLEQDVPRARSTPQPEPAR